MIPRVQVNLFQLNSSYKLVRNMQNQEHAIFPTSLQQAKLFKGGVYEDMMFHTGSEYSQFDNLKCRVVSLNYSLPPSHLLLCPSLSTQWRLLAFLQYYYYLVYYYCLVFSDQAIVIFFCTSSKRCLSPLHEFSAAPLRCNVTLTEQHK